MNTNEPQGTSSEKKSPAIPGAVNILSFMAENFGPLIVFLALDSLFGLKEAIGGTVAYTIVDVGRRAWYKLPLPMLYVVSGGMTVGFGAIDLFADTPFMLRFEPVLSSLIMSGIFLAGAKGKVSMLQGMVEQKRGKPFVNRPDLERFFRYLTLLWTAYFLFKAVLYLWLALALPLDQVLTVRAVFGNISLLAMVLLTTTQARRIYWLMQGWGWLPARPDENGAEPSDHPLR